jgi:16S rRNA (guanine527-N7)-methyltransferase
MDAARLAELLHPFIASLTPDQLAAISNYLDLLLRWNAHTNLTAIREPEEIVTRHFGESLFAAAQLLPKSDVRMHAIDVGSGAGFPGLPLKIYAPGLHLTLIESQQKKATFLKEVVRTLHLDKVDVFTGRAQDCPAHADLVTLRAVERFEIVLPAAASLLRYSCEPPSRLALLIGSEQVELAHVLLPAMQWQAPIPIPQSTARVVLVGKRLG